MSGWTTGFPEIMETASADASEMTCSATEITVLTWAPKNEFSEIICI